MDEQVVQDVQEMLTDLHPELELGYFGPWEEEIVLANGETIKPVEDHLLLDVRRPSWDERGELGILLPFPASSLDEQYFATALRPLVRDAYENATGEPIYG